MRHGLGPFRFDVRNAPLTSLKRDSDYRWAAQERALRAPGMQFLGPGEDQITLSATVYPLVLSPGGINQIAGLRSAARTGARYPLVAISGEVFGLWVITGIEEEQTYFAPTGEPQKIECSISLSAYGPDGAGLGFNLF